MRGHAADPEADRKVREYVKQQRESRIQSADCPNCGKDSCPGCEPKRSVEFNSPEEGCYEMAIPDFGLRLRVDRLRRKSSELVGELAVRCSMPGAKTVGDESLAASDLNLSSQRARQDRAKFLGGRAQAPDLDWTGIIEEFCQRVISAERAGRPAQLLRDIPRPRPDDVHPVDGLPFLARHPMVLFGDGGAAKSYFALYAAGRLDQQGVRVGLFDWELAGEDHRDRLDRLFGAELPAIRYARCDRPLVHEADRLRRIVRDERLEYVILDSVAFACDGPPEAAEVAARYFQALRRLGQVGSLNIAHVTKAEGGDRKPFGSTFWHNGARSTWFAKVAETLPTDKRITLGLYNRKANLGGIKPAVGFDITFAEQATTFRRVEVANIPDLAGHLSVRLRMVSALQSGALDADTLASEIDADPETVRRTARRNRNQFVLLEGGKYGLKGAEP